ncbi:MAG TPA: hypothetical protein VJ161_09530, partial [Geobacteraceae bacterium]|nr:hypothetical protein [Geobacteraceae bacterium]
MGVYPCAEQITARLHVSLNGMMNGLLSPANRVTPKRLQLLLTERAKHRDEKGVTKPSHPAFDNRCPCCEEGVMVVIN